MPTLLLSREDLELLLSDEEILSTVEEVYKRHGLGHVVMPPKITLDLSMGKYKGSVNVMPAFLLSDYSVGVKFGGNFPLNPFRENLPNNMASILLMDPRRGYPLAIVEGGYITVARTGASSVVCAQYLSPSVKMLGIIGLGEIGRAAMFAFDRAFSLEEIRVYDISKASIEEALRSRMLRAPVSFCATAEECTVLADVVITATHNDKPLFAPEASKPGALIITLGSFRELDPLVVMKSAYLVVDDLEQNKHRGEFKKYFEEDSLRCSDIYGELGDIVAGRIPRPSAGREWGVASLIGMGSFDVALAKKAYEIGRTAHRGCEFDFG